MVFCNYQRTEWLILLLHYFVTWEGHVSCDLGTTKGPETSVYLKAH